MIVLRHVSTRPPHERGPQRRTRHDVGANAVDRVAGHERYLVDPDGALAREQDGEAREGMVAVGRNVNVRFDQPPPSPVT